MLKRGGISVANSQGMGRIRNTVEWMARHKIASVSVLLALVGLTVWAQDYRSRATGILTDPLKKADIVESVYGIGTIVAKRSMQLRPGQVSSINRYWVKEGDSVRRGAPLVELSDVIWRAPFDGVVTNIPFKTGENVYAQSPVLTLTDLADRYMTISLEQKGALRVKPGQKARVSFDSMRDERFEGVVHSVYSYESSFLARIDLPPLPAHILPGMTADVAIIIRARENTLVAPVAAFTGDTVWVKRGRAAPREVKVELGLIDQAMAEISSGDVREGDRLLIKGGTPK